MPSFKISILALLAASASAMPPSFRLNARQLKVHELTKRQQEGAQQSGLSDFDILQLCVSLSIPVLSFSHTCSTIQSAATKQNMS